MSSTVDGIHYDPETSLGKAIMSRFSAELFSWIQGAAFYEDLHGNAVRLLPPGDGRTWLDVGCGPGLVTRLAGRHGYDAVGIDRDPAMIRAARRIARDEGCRFEVGELGIEQPPHSGDVVSAASLLIVLPDARRALAQLWACVRPGGILLVIETTTHMTPERAKSVAPRTRPGRRTALALWARARRGHAIDPTVFDGLDSASRERHALLEGLVDAWILRKGVS
jgi:SAM-dependent methyltransferase